MKPTENIITNREQVRINQWWQSSELNDARGEYHSLLLDHVERLVKDWSPPHLVCKMDGSRGAAQSLFADALMPQENATFQQVRMAYPFDRNAGEVADDYSDDARRSRLSIPQWFALMVRTWTFDTVQHIGRGGEVNPDHSEHYSSHEFDYQCRRDASVDPYEKAPWYTKRPTCNLGNIAPHAITSQHAKICDVQWPKQESLQLARRQYVGGMIAVIEKALSAIPKVEEAEVRRNMRLVMAELEPSWRNRARKVFLTNLDSSNIWMPKIMKGWFAEVSDLYLYGVQPSPKFDYKTYVTNVMHCSIRQIFPSAAAISDMHIRVWMHRGPENRRMYDILKGHEDQRHFLLKYNNVRTFAPDMMQTLAEARANGRVIEKYDQT